MKKLPAVSPDEGDIGLLNGDCCPKFVRFGVDGLESLSPNRLVGVTAVALVGEESLSPNLFVGVAAVDAVEEEAAATEVPEFADVVVIDFELVFVS